MQSAGRAVAPCAREPRPRRQVGAGADRGGALILGAVLAGGRSSRFGSDKALAVWRGQTLLDRALATLAPWCAAVVVVGRERPGQAPITDRPRAGMGPLGGIAGALDYAESSGFDSVLTIACDMPVVPDEVLAALVATAPSFCTDAPVLGHWPSGLADAAARHLTAVAPAEAGAAALGAPAPPRQPSGPGLRRGDGINRRSLSVRRWAEAIGATPIASPTPLRNVNTPADLTP